MGLGRRLLIGWLIASAVWLGLVYLYLTNGGWFPGHWEVRYPLREGIGEPPAENYTVSTPLPRPLYEIIRSPSAEQLPVVFQPRGIQGISAWDTRLNVGQWEPQRFADGSKLWLQPALTEADRRYIADAFWRQRWSRWRTLLQPWLPTAAIPPLGLFGLLWAVRQLVLTIKDRPAA